jgi:hypothetical protein
VQVFDHGLFAGKSDVQPGETETFGCRQELRQRFDRQAQHIQIDQPVEITQARRLPARAGEARARPECLRQ